MDSRKSMRHFYCRDALWEAFEQMANEFTVSIDYLINDSMRHYAKNKGYLSKEKPGAQMYSNSPNPPTIEFSRSRKSPPPLPGKIKKHNSGSFSVDNDIFGDSQPETVPLTLYIKYNGEKYPVEKDQFIIGRVSRLCDLTLKDANISRKHSAVIKRNGSYYIKDLGSTNGIEFNGIRIDNKRIDEGDTFFLCDHKLEFTFK
ncbi:MAG: FHA domain-containing protein [Deltaproteobacteria bacterium]|jgi:hypothetical protein|nr:FHA domain-containing protein [Deltaproteobacteria bacterium]